MDDKINFIEKYKKYFIKYICSINTNIIFWFALLLILFIIKILISYDYDELFSKAYEIGKLFEILASGLLVSGIFYFFVVHIKKMDEKEKVENLVKWRIDRIKGVYLKDIIDTLLKNANKNIKEEDKIIIGEFPTDNDIKLICDKLDDDDIIEVPPYYPENIDLPKRYFIKFYKFIETRVHEIKEYSFHLENKDLLNLCDNFEKYDIKHKLEVNPNGLLGASLPFERFNDIMREIIEYNFN